LLIRVQCGVKTTTATTGNVVKIVVDGDHAHEMPPVAKLLPSTKLEIQKMIMQGRQTTGAICNFLQAFPDDPAARQEERVNAAVRKSHKVLFGEDLDFGGLERLCQVIIKEDFVREAVNNVADPSRTICFLQTKFQQNLINDCDYLFGDISYKLCRLYYKMVMTGFNHVTRKGAVVATAYLRRADGVSYEVFFLCFFRKNKKLITVTHSSITFSFTALGVDFSDAQRKGIVNAVIIIARENGCQLSSQEIERLVLLILKGCGFHFDQSVEKVSKSGALLHHRAKVSFTPLVRAWLQSSTMQLFNQRKAQLLQEYPSVKGWIAWWALPIHAVLIFPGVRKELLQETDEMYGHLPSTNNFAEATNSVESRLCKHNVELIPSIHDSYRMTKRQEEQHEGQLSGAPLLPQVPTHLLL